MNSFDYQKIYPFKWYVLQNFPFIEEDIDAITNYQLYSKVIEKLNVVINSMNLTGEQMESLTNAMITLQNYVNNYFENLDVQDEINNKLDEMVTDGTLESIFGNYIDDYIKPQLNDLQTQIDSLASGSPLVASSTSQMTDTTKIYVNTTDGHWYYYNGTAWTDGGIYQGTAVSNTDPTILEMNARLNQYMNFYYFDESASFNTPFEVKTGQKVHIKVTSITATVTVFTVNNSSDTYAQISQERELEFTALHDGFLRFYFARPGNMQGYCYIDNKLINLINENTEKVDESNYNYIPNTLSLNSLQLKEKRIYNNFTNLTNKTYGFNASANIENYENYVASSSVSLPTPMIRVRDNLGNLIYEIELENFDNISDYHTGIGLWAFDSSGKFLRVQRYIDLKERGYLIADDEYYVILNKFPNVTNYTYFDFIIKDLQINWLNNKENNVYHVGVNKDFETFTEMLIALQNDTSEKTIYIDSGTYDIFEEMGGSTYMQTLVDSASTLNWRDVCHVVPENTHLIGIGKVVLQWIATAEEMQSQDIAYLFSPLNVSGNCTIENIEVVAQNCRYAIHDETSGLAKFNGATHIYNNVIARFLNSTYGVKIPYGAGHNRDMTIKFNNCKFINYSQNLWSTHDWNYPENAPSLFEINNCIFTRENESQTDGFIRFSSSDTVGKKDIVKINNSFINGNISISTEGTSNVRQGYEITLIGSSNVNVNYSEYITTRYGINQYNSHI